MKASDLMLQRLAGQPEGMYGRELMGIFRTKESTFQVLTALIDAGLIEQHKNAVGCMYTITTDGLVALHKTLGTP